MKRIDSMVSEAKVRLIVRCGEDIQRKKAQYSNSVGKVSMGHTNLVICTVSRGVSVRNINLIKTQR